MTDVDLTEARAAYDKWAELEEDVLDLAEASIKEFITALTERADAVGVGRSHVGWPWFQKDVWTVRIEDGLFSWEGYRDDSRGGVLTWDQVFDPDAQKKKIDYLIEEGQRQEDQFNEQQRKHREKGERAQLRALAEKYPDELNTTTKGTST